MYPLHECCLISVQVPTMSAVWVIVTMQILHECCLGDNNSLCTHSWVLFGWYLFRCQLHEWYLSVSSYTPIAWVLFGWNHVRYPLHECCLGDSGLFVENKGRQKWVWLCNQSLSLSWCHFPMHECCLGDSGYIPIAWVLFRYPLWVLCGWYLFRYPMCECWGTHTMSAVWVISV